MTQSWGVEDIFLEAKGVIAELRLKGEWALAGRGGRVGKLCGQLESMGWSGELRRVWCSRVWGRGRMSRPGHVQFSP